MSATRRSVVVVAVLAVLAAAVVGWRVAARDDRPPTTVVDGRKVWLIEHPECDDSASCAAGVTFGGRFWATGDSLVRPEFTRGPLVAHAPNDGEPQYAVEARAIEGFPPPHEVVALRTPAGWVAAFADAGRMGPVTEKAWYDRLCQVIEGECRRPSG